MVKLAATTTSESEEAVKETLLNVEKVEKELPEFLSSLSDSEMLSPLQRAHSLFSLAKITNTLFSLKLRCRGVNPRAHPIKSEFERLTLYQRKLQHLFDLAQAQNHHTNVTYQDQQPAQKRKFPSSEADDDQFHPTIQEPILIDLSSDDDHDDH
ncbi:hypothetical protein TanjilG_01270 [Lupinus angustifolius]|uniref:Nuclear nucleic acid-binding protein C1D n=1 Tax=Lupinus angustifolius TaxID=3871 RepID=A0A4P1RE92_LUPAN|nr:PREDICTED: nuclear nucleic acid-binding protein C1D-like [Lupinus angustifolius]OIW09299.1 hypothetical protein TanjilG_01270 [Lupinus angustifolius]